MYGYAGRTLPAGYSAILNATSPIWGRAAGRPAAGRQAAPAAMAGHAVGGGRGGRCWSSSGRLRPQSRWHWRYWPVWWRPFAMAYRPLGQNAMAAAFHPSKPLPVRCWRHHCCCCQPLPLAPVYGPMSSKLVLIMLALALLCSALAYLLYFRLVANIGPGKALTVTFLVPLFALLWGALFLNESLDWSTVAGCGGGGDGDLAGNERQIVAM